MSTQIETTRRENIDSLTSEPVAGVLKRVFRDAQAADRILIEDYEKLLKADREKAVSKILDDEAKDYKNVYRNFASNYLNVSPSFGRLIYMLARAGRARHIVEFGTSFGVSTIYLACALRDNGGGKLIGTELEPTKAARARETLAEAGLADFVEIRVGDALETLRDEIEEHVDLVLLDGAFSLYLPVLKLLESRLKTGALVIGENAFEESRPYFDYVRNPANGYLSQPLPMEEGRGNELTLVTGSRAS